MKTDLEISKALALAIGWREDQMYISLAGQIFIRPEKFRVFDYRDPTVIWPIAAKYNRFPSRCSSGVWSSNNWFTEANTPELAVAEVVIRMAQK